MKFDTLSFVSVSIALLFLSSFCEFGFCREDPLIRMTTLGGLRDFRGNVQNSAELENVGRFAVQEHNKNENALLEFGRVIKAKQQVVAGILYHLTLEAIDSGKRKVYEAKVWVKPWMNFKQLQEFKHIHDAHSFTPFHVGVKRDGNGLGWQALPTYDPLVQDAAHHAVRTIQQRSNSVHPYELIDILMAKAEVIENYVKFDLLLKVRRGIKEERFKVDVNMNTEGSFYMNHMKQVHSGKC